MKLLIFKYYSVLTSLQTTWRRKHHQTKQHEIMPQDVMHWVQALLYWGFTLACDMIKFFKVNYSIRVQSWCVRRVSTCTDWSVSWVMYRGTKRVWERERKSIQSTWSLNQCVCKDGLSVCNLYVHTVCGDITGQRSLCPPARTHINAHTHINVSLLVYQDKRAAQSQKLVTQWCHWADEEMASEEFDVIHLHHSPSVLLCAAFSNFSFSLIHLLPVLSSSVRAGAKETLFKFMLK